MGSPSPDYTPKSPGQGVLYQVVRDHLETFRAEAARVYERDALPRFIEEEFRGFLRCGFLAGGFARFHCGRCGLDRFVPFSCKGRAVCPSCGGRRMAEPAAHLVDDVFPVVPVRQWVLSLPHRLRYVLAWDHTLCRAVSGVFVRAVLGSLRRRARRTSARGGRGGAVAIIQRFGAALNLNVHVHALVLDGVYVEDGGILRFHEAMPPTDDEMDRLLGTIDRRVHRLLARRGVVDDLGEGNAADPWREEAPMLAGIAGASVQGRRALGERAGAVVRRCGASAELLALAPSGRGPCHARGNVPCREHCRTAESPPLIARRTVLQHFAIGQMREHGLAFQPLANTFREAVVSRASKPLARMRGGRMPTHGAATCVAQRVTAAPYVAAFPARRPMARVRHRRDRAARVRQ